MIKIFQNFEGLEKKNGVLQGLLQLRADLGGRNALLAVQDRVHAGDGVLTGVFWNRHRRAVRLHLQP